MGLLRRGREAAGEESPFVTAASIYVDRPPERVWDFIYEPANEVLYFDSALRGFFVPETPRQTVGEQRCLLMMSARRRSKGAVNVFAQRVADIEWGVRLGLHEQTAGRSNGRMFTLEPAGRGCRLLLEQQMTIGPGQNQEHLRRVGDWLPKVLHRIKKSIESGAEPPAPDIPSRLPGDGRSVAVVTSQSVDIAVPATTLWGLLQDPGSALNRADGHHAFRLPGSPAGQVGEMWCVLRPREDRVVGGLGRTTALEPGRLVVDENMSSRYPHKITTMVEPNESGSRLTLEFETLVPRADKETLTRSDGEAMTRAINRIKGNAERGL